ncbi:putative ABC transporter ATP-binding protein YfmR [Gracilariopsis chorda]|uniref:Probable ATP-dependent transporter ycf16 n=1 Tax=Gracilariopsis chorda TaxID=448386 RepID=A0A2V3ISV6_9FLOR|nr:putative ABC transporter ATP-binding protein YfmR [Gracilariopsis chorda]|eukprot:PXF45182.1 putative ABC transporter ATP-binding protein YfmR [Gracilariopsis chorda]
MSAERILWATNLSKSHDGQSVQFKKLSLDIPHGAKLALLGRSGVGKSTLLSVLAGITAPDEGSVTLRKGANLAYVSQNLPDVKAETVLDAVMQLAARYTNSDAVRVALRYASLMTRLQTQSDSLLLEQLAEATSTMDQTAGAWETESYLNAALTRLDVPLHIPLCSLSGGQKRRVAIAAALVAKPDILLLDEVTNHLSIDAVQFIEEVLAEPATTVLAISHDRFFVDRVCVSGIWELDGELLKYGGGYDAYLEKKAQSMQRERKLVADLSKAYKKELEWMRRQPKARGTKSKSRVAEVLKMQQQLCMRKKRLNSAEVKELKTGTSRLGTEVVRVEKVTLKRGDKLIVKDLSYTFERGERVGLVGGNGVGKSSFIELLLGRVAAQEGKVHVGETVRFGHFDQEGIDLSRGLTEVSKLTLNTQNWAQVRVVDYVKELLALHGPLPQETYPSTRTAATKGGGGGGGGGGDVGDEAEQRVSEEIERLSYSVTVTAAARKEAVSNPLAKMQPSALLEQFGFDREKHFNFVGSLSGGEKRRLQLIGLLLQNANFLLLDEVSNDLDLNTLTMLEEVLADYKGVLVLCSHDRFMLDRLVDHLLVFEGDGVVNVVEGKFTDYVEVKKQLEAESKKERKKEAASQERERSASERRRKRKLSYKEQREYDGLEAQIDRLQERHGELTALVGAQARSAPYTTLCEWTSELARIERDMDRNTNRWIELADIAGD